MRMAEDTQPVSLDVAATPDVDALRDQLANAIAMSAKQDQIVWAVFGVFWAAGAVLLVALFTTGDAPSRSVGLVVSSAGTVLSVVWAIIRARAIGYLHFYDSVVQEIETRLKLPADIALSGRINKRLHSANVKGIPVRDLMVKCTIAVAVLWAITLAWFYSEWPSLV